MRWDRGGRVAEPAVFLNKTIRRGGRGVHSFCGLNLDPDPGFKKRQESNSSRVLKFNNVR